MARMQIVPLPPLRSGEFERTPFVVVIDQLGDDHGLTSEPRRAAAPEHGS